MEFDCEQQIFAPICRDPNTQAPVYRNLRGYRDFKRPEILFVLNSIDEGHVDSKFYLTYYHIGYSTISNWKKREADPEHSLTGRVGCPRKLNEISTDAVQSEVAKRQKGINPAPKLMIRIASRSFHCS